MANELIDIKPKVFAICTEFCSQYVNDLTNGQKYKALNQFLSKSETQLKSKQHAFKEFQRDLENIEGIRRRLTEEYEKAVTAIGELIKQESSIDDALDAHIRASALSMAKYQDTKIGNNENADELLDLETNRTEWKEKVSLNR